MPERLCPSCSAWECAGDDAYCGNCGNPTAQLSMEALPSVLHIGQIAPNVGFRVSNPTCGTLPVSAIRRPDWITLLGQPPLVLAPHGTSLFYGRASTYKMGQPSSDLLQVDTPAGNASALLMAIPEKPGLKTIPAELLIWNDPRRSGRQRIELHFSPLSGSLRVLSVKNAGFHWITLAGRPSAPVIASPENPVAISLEVEVERISRLEVKSAELAVEYDDAHGPKTTLLPLNFVLRNRPELRWTGENAPPPTLIQTDKQPIRFVFTNRSEDDVHGGRMNAAIVLESVTLTAAKNAPAIPVMQPAFSPTTIAGGDSCEVEVELNLESVKPGIHSLLLEARTNIAELNERPYHAAVEVRELRSFDGIIAIDFGTSNTCCAVLENGAEFESIPLDGASTTDPTIVRYLDWHGRFPEIETGVRVKNLAASDEKVAASTVTRLKQQLGETTWPLRIRARNSTDWVYREARLAARDYLHHVRVAAERQKGATFHEFILTHPAVCSIRQYRNLRFALEEAFGKDARVHFLQEPIAALVPFFEQRAKDPNENGYTVAAFDLGGGTTDITVVRVNHQRNGAGVQIQPEIIASWGERFGGENLTDFLVGQIRSRCQQILAAKYPGFDLADYPVRGASSPDILRNEAALRDWAERLKAGLSDEQAPRKLDTLLLRAISKRPDAPPADAAFEPADLENVGGAPLQAVFVAFTKTQIARIAERLKQSVAGMAPLQYIHLSGKTTFLPVVRETLQSAFKAAIFRADDPKECVVRGACLSRSMARSRSRRLILPRESQRTTSQIGLMDDDTGRFLPVIPLDSPIPAGGLARDIPNAWNGTDVVVLWENLGVEQTKVLSDGARNPFLQKLGTWEPEREIELADNWWGLRLTLTPVFTLEVSAVGPDGQSILFRQRTAGGLA
ncbi:MAG TPA: Hsp70 family protein [Bryobacteraceae bacterium]|nr:Hsp70 family protein [Bryobacteraceae bacterium]